MGDRRKRSLRLGFDGSLKLIWRKSHRKELPMLRVPRRSRPRTLSALSVLIAVTPVMCAHAASILITNPPAMQKVQPATGDAGPQADILRIAMARGEYEPVQIVVHAASGSLSGVRVSVSGLIGAAEQPLPGERVAVNPVGFLNCARPTGGGAPLTGEIPDVMLPDRPMDVPEGRRQPFFITVHTLSSDEAGE